MQELKLLQKLVKQRRFAWNIPAAEQGWPGPEEQEEIGIDRKIFAEADGWRNPESSGLQKIIVDTGAASPADIDKVMGSNRKQLAGQADGKPSAQW